MDLSNDHSNPKGGQNDETTPKDDKQDYSVNSESSKSESSNDESIDESCNEINIYESNDIDDFKEFICDIIENYVEQNIFNIMSPKFEQQVITETNKELLASYCDISSRINKDDLLEIITECMNIYNNLISIPRSYNKDICEQLDKEKTTKQINKLREIPQPEQNTPEWFDIRWTKLTASSAWKTFGTEASYNSLIYSKCCPIDTSKYKNVNIESATHHGHKYEEISTLFYEHKFNTKIEEFGCLSDETVDFIAASPDGINIKKDNDKYGYLLEIKNPVSRKLTGIPKLEYWIQMQQQMYVTKLHYCDFLETVIKEYENEEAFNNDGSFMLCENGNVKGVILCFNDGNKPIYKYPPFQISKKKFDIWYDKTMEENKNLTWINNSYWYMENYSCVTVPFHKKWFDIAIPKFKTIWDIILKERKEGYQHRKPKQRRKITKIIKQEQNNIIPPRLVIEMADNLKVSKL